MCASYCLKDAYILKNHQLVKEDLWIDKGKIACGPLSDYQTLSFPAKIIAPGFIDIQINGAFGIDFTTQLEGINVVAKHLPKMGVTSFLPTIISSPKIHYHSILPQINAIKKLLMKQHGAHFLGLHLEGPFFNPEKIGAHPKGCIPDLSLYPIDFDFFKSYYGSLDHVKIITLAPELPGMLNVIKDIEKRNIIAAIGHSLASFKIASESFKTGVSLVTHLFNAMGPLNQREPGLIGATLKSSKTHSPFYSLIADCQHVHPAMIEIAWNANPQCILITDGIAPLGLKPEEIRKQNSFPVGLNSVSIETGGNFIEGIKILAGGITPLNICLKNFIEMTQCSLIQGLETVTLNPAVLLGINHYKGSLNIGFDADLVVLDDSFNVIKTFINGQLYSN